MLDWDNAQRSDAGAAEAPVRGPSAAADATFQQLLESASDAVVATDVAGRIVLVNAETERLFGYPRNELLDQPIELLVPEALRAGHVGHRAKYPTLAMGATVEAVGRRKDGSEVAVEITLSRLDLPAGSRMIAVVRDLSERRRLLATLRDHDLRLRAMFAHASQFLGLLTPDGVVLEVSQSALAFAGYLGQEPIGQRLWETRWWTWRPELPERIRKACAHAARGEPVRFETQQRSVDGRTITVDYCLSPVRGVDGAVEFLQFEAFDVSERKQLEQLREDSLALVSHDLKNPLSVIGLRAAMLRRALSAGGQTRELTHADVILDCVERLGLMLDELLGVALLESGTMELQRELVDLTALATGTLVRAVAPAELGRFRVTSTGRLMVEVDEPRLERVIVNLVTNTLKYSTPGTPIDLSIAGEADQVRFELSDRSPGMSAEVAARVFDKYHRAEATRQVEGLGIGLYACKLMIEAHGGRIWVDSVPGIGSTFGFTLARAGGPREALAGPATPHPRRL